MSKRWKIKITYSHDGPPERREIEELHELQNLIEMGPNWNTINKITVRLNKDAT